MLQGRGFARRAVGPGRVNGGIMLVSVIERARERRVLRTRAVDVSLWEAVLPPEVLRLPDELARVDVE